MALAPLYLHLLLPRARTHTHTHRPRDSLRAATATHPISHANVHSLLLRESVGRSPLLVMTQPTESLQVSLTSSDEMFEESRSTS